MLTRFGFFSTFFMPTGKRWLNNIMNGGQFHLMLIGLPLRRPLYQSYSPVLFRNQYGEQILCELNFYLVSFALT
jgi:hypothetical protein